MRLCAVSVDLDEIPNYYQIHGLPIPKRAETAVYDLALPRLFDFAALQQIPLTLFVIGKDLTRTEAVERLRAARALGHEIGNHSLDHLYDLTRRSRAEIERQVRIASERIEHATGFTPTGFRAPGYTTNDTLYSVLTDAGVRYSSSVFPSPAYYAAKSAAIGLYRVLGRRSHSVVDTPYVLGAPRNPYRVGKPYWTPGDGLWEFPIQVTQHLRLPYIGTTLTLAGPERARWLTRGVIGAPFVNLELHGIDVLDTSDGLQDLAPHQRDVRVKLARKLATLSGVIEQLREAGYRFVRLDEVAGAWEESVSD